MTHPRLNGAFAAILATGFSFAFVLVTMPLGAVLAVGGAA
jgi:hypothetical protein